MQAINFFWFDLPLDNRVWYRTLFSSAPLYLQTEWALLWNEGQVAWFPGLNRSSLVQWLLWDRVLSCSYWRISWDLEKTGGYKLITLRARIHFYDHQSYSQDLVWRNTNEKYAPYDPMECHHFPPNYLPIFSHNSSYLLSIISEMIIAKAYSVYLSVYLFVCFKAGFTVL